MKNINKLREISYRILSRYTSNKSVQDDIFETLVEKVSKDPKIYEERGKLIPWLNVTLRNMYVDKDRAEKREAERLESYRIWKNSTYSDQMDPKLKQREVLDEYIEDVRKSTTDKIELQIVIRYYVHFETKTDIARGLDVSIKKVRRIIDVHRKKIDHLYEIKNFYQD